ncbi:TRAP transporter small permease subunit [Minwuia thermotolerans]|uniref:TRAP transporter small permease protein n=1 Tax=Minwuia thermotolerans TaxID=2056226 RepID=A0A2M9G5A8_9PROT|nr:TRAP transporter small permease [Minwuia thermotolerans]PJK30891.1 TRAP transporter small permease [Minwuia thermotolerans]
MTEQSAAGGLSRTDRWLFAIETAFNLIAAFSIFGLMLLGVVQVFSRILLWLDQSMTAAWGFELGLGFSIVGYIDVVEQAIALFAFLGIAYCQKMGGHVRMDLALRGLSRRALWISEATAILLSLFVVAVLVYYGIEHFLRAVESEDSTIDIRLPVWPSKLLVPVAFSLLWLRLLVQFVAFLRLVASPEKEPVAVPTIQTIEEIARHEIDESDESRYRQGG